MFTNFGGVGKYVGPYRLGSGIRSPSNVGTSKARYFKFCIHIDHGKYYLKNNKLTPNGVIRSSNFVRRFNTILWINDRTEKRHVQNF